MNHYKSVIGGFSDTLQIISKLTKRKGKGQNKLETLANDLNIDIAEAHNAICDVDILEKVLRKLNITDKMILQSSLSWDVALQKMSFSKNLPNAMKNLNALEKCMSYGMRKKMILANISYDMVLDAYRENKFSGISNILGEDENGRISVTKNRKILKKICDYLESISN